MSEGLPLIIAVAPNGARKTQSDHPALPLTADELADAAWQSLGAGAAMIHLHVRDDANRHTLDVSRYRMATSAIRARVGSDMIVQVTTEAVGIYTPEQQMAMVRELRPEAVSLAVRELCPPEMSEDQASDFFWWLQREGIAPQYILYSKEDAMRFEALRESGVIPGDRVSVLYVLGRYGGGEHTDAAQLLPTLLAAMQGEVIWSVCAFGADEASCMATAAGLGGHCRVGFENNMQLASGAIAPNNAALVAQLVAATGRPVASPAQARNLLGMP